MPKIERLKLTNFKSFESVDVELSDFNVLIGPNASGKSNFVQALKFLRDIANHDLENATSMQGGIEYLTNARLGRRASVSVEAQLALAEMALPTGTIRAGRALRVKPYRATYHLEVEKATDAASIQILQDHLTLECKYVVANKTKGRGPKGGKEVAKYKIRVFLEDNRIQYQYRKLDGRKLKKKDILAFPFRLDIRVRGNAALLEIPFFGFPFVPLHDFFSNISIYDFDPKLPKKAVLMTGKSDLEEDGSNLAIVLKNIVSDRAKKEEFIKLVRDVLPFVEDLGVERFADQSMLVTLRERYTPDVDLPAYLVSDGTITITALIAALYFQKDSLAVFEEPDRNAHPLLISRIVNMLKEVSKRQQVIVTTHNPEMVRHVGIDDLLLIGRDEEGFSTISRPAKSDRVREFLKDDIGVEELHVAGFLGDNL